MRGARIEMYKGTFVPPKVPRHPHVEVGCPNFIRRAACVDLRHPCRQRRDHIKVDMLRPCGGQNRQPISTKAGLDPIHIMLNTLKSAWLIILWKEFLSSVERRELDPAEFVVQNHRHDLCPGYIYAGTTNTFVGLFQSRQTLTGGAPVTAKM